MYNIKVKVIHTVFDNGMPNINEKPLFEATLEYFNHRADKFVTAFERGSSPKEAKNKLISLLNSGSKRY
tara:strand:- start:3692 stop:3898 length:207 start_codon:yes stop_codon:yes gene_type:complete